MKAQQLFRYKSCQVARRFSRRLHSTGKLEMDMRQIIAEVLTPHAALDAFTATWRKATELTAIPRLAFGTFHELFSAITEPRLNLLRQLAVYAGATSIELASAVGRDYNTVQRDITELMDLGLIELDKQGRLFAPFDEIIIRADIRAAA